MYKKIKIFCLISTLFILIGVGCSQSDFRQKSGVHKNNINLQKSTVANLDKKVMDIKKVNNDKILISTANKVYKLNPKTGSLDLYTELPERQKEYTGGMSQIIVDKQGVRFYDLFGVYNEKGKMIKDFNALTPGFTNIKAEDLDNDGLSEIVVGDDSIKIYNRNGKRIGLNVQGSSSFEFADYDGDGSTDILIFDYDKVVVVNHEGKRIDLIKKGGESNLVSHYSYPTKSDSLTFTRIDSQEIYPNPYNTDYDSLRIIDTKTEKTRQELDLKGPFSLRKVENINLDSDNFLALLGAKDYQGRALVGFEFMDSELLILNSDLGLSYHEVYHSECPSLVKLGNMMLIGCGKNIYEYSLK